MVEVSEVREDTLLGLTALCGDLPVRFLTLIPAHVRGVEVGAEQPVVVHQKVVGDDIQHLFDLDVVGRAGAKKHPSTSGTGRNFMEKEVVC